MRRLLGLTAALFSVTTMAGCATMNVSSHVQANTDFTRYHTYDWGPPDALPTGDPRLDKDPFFQDHMEGAVEKEMAAKGFAHATSGVPDLLIHYHASITQKLDVSTADKAYACKDCKTGYVYDAGTLLIDVVDARTSKIVWRGWSEGSMDGAIDDQAWMEKTIDDAVARILEKLPRRL